ncbi:DgyrCDS5206 [Dimorphilus gyrociliatus]|uniref:cyclin-dependent kinase n=1 Tax=Dimorphilus gyrociliatus TaxID=2664684 RepID=A0A7I8VLH8_9ANNE|nr:DgyrCDS5206 [Dimorphilus gyrociliatus]
MQTSYERKEKLGEGTYGVVYKAINSLTGECVALKRIDYNKNGEREGVPSTALREVNMLKQLEHDNVVKLLNVFCDTPQQGSNSTYKLYLVFEFCDMDLKKLMEQNGGLDYELTKSYMKQLLDGMAFCHGRKILHRDLKPQNLLVTSDGKIKIADFGLARMIQIPSRKYTHEVITLWYRSPEILLGTDFYCPSVDIWSLGCIFAEMPTGKPLFPADSEIDQLMRIFRTLGTPNEDIWPGVTNLPDFQTRFPQFKVQEINIQGLDNDGMDLFRKMIIYDPSKRWSAIMCLKHEYLNNVNLDVKPVFRKVEKDKSNMVKNLSSMF